MAKCKVCQRKGFTVETDVNGLCQTCSPYYYLTMPDDLKALTRALQIIDRSGQPEDLADTLTWVCQPFSRIKPYVQAGLVQLPRPIKVVERLLKPVCGDMTNG